MAESEVTSPAMASPASRSPETLNSTLDKVPQCQAPTAEERGLSELQIKWEGTNVLQETDTGERLSKEKLESLINERAKTERSLKENPYDPVGWLNLAEIYFDLCYSDLQVSAAQKSLILIGFGRNLREPTLGRVVREAIRKRIPSSSDLTPAEELEILKLRAHITVLRGLYDAESYWEGRQEAKRILKLYPESDEVLTIQRMLNRQYKAWTSALKGSKATGNELKHLLQSGRMRMKQYPWMDEKLFIRTARDLTNFNKELNSKSCEIRCAQFKDSEPNLGTSGDLGPLGIFAARNILKDEILLVDSNTTLVSNIPPATMTHCEACHASLHAALIEPSEVKVAQCCKAAAYCSSACYDLATNGYHSVLCGKDFKWLYDSASKGGDPSEDNASWRPLVLLRMLAVIISDLKRASGSTKAQGDLNPLSHSLVSRLTANYSDVSSSENEWTYFSHVIAPNRILMQLGVDIFSDSKWSAEIVHTIYWRMVNNACKTASIVINEDPSAEDGFKIEPYTVTGISPGYIFFNHACKPSVNWMAAGSGYGMGFLNGVKADADKRRVKAGGSAMLCIAVKDLKAGEEARISYVPEGHNKESLARWFHGGCGCDDCGKESGNR